MSDEAEKPAPTKKSSGSGSKLGPLLLVLNLGATGFVGFKIATAKSGGSNAPHPVEIKPTTEIGPTAPLEAFVVNLNEPNATRYLRTTFEAELSDEKAKAPFEKGAKLVRDEVLRYLSNLSVSDTMGDANKSKIQTEIVERINKTLGAKLVTRLFLTEFVVQ